MNWGKVQNVGVRVLVPLVTAIITYVVTTANANREFKAKMIEDAIRVLAAPVCDTTRTLQKWAATVLGRYSDVPFNAGAESMLVRVGPVLFAEVVGRQFRRLLLCDSAGNNCRMLERVLPVTNSHGEEVAWIIISPKTITISPRQATDLTAYGVERTGDRVSIAVTWRATGGSITAQEPYGAHARYTAPSAPGDYTVIASFSGLADTALVHVQP